MQWMNKTIIRQTKSFGNILCRKSERDDTNNTTVLKINLKTERLYHLLDAIKLSLPKNVYKIIPKTILGT